MEIEKFNKKFSGMSSENFFVKNQSELVQLFCVMPQDLIFLKPIPIKDGVLVLKNLDKENIKNNKYENKNIEIKRFDIFVSTKRGLVSYVGRVIGFTEDELKSFIILKNSKDIINEIAKNRLSKFKNS